MGELRPSLPRRSPGAALRELSTVGSVEQAGPAGLSCSDGGPCPVAAGVAERLRAFTDAVLGLHRVMPAAPGFIPMCSCGLPARCCDIVKAEHEVLGIAMPFTFGPLRPSNWEVADASNGV